ncbi:alpha/beta-hydrolase [Schizophyllum amplum]|uniref:Alpha/beta-hydrolase n=1 Tax=Schizophyllum amplum TaxID=97359 RepID=A0A550CUR0_9AGAR|nr:alpha/beta-hydrolase [Auriculariopsis ampla]
MPFVDLHSADDYARIHYTTNTLFNNVGGFDPEKPTVVILHPNFLDSTWLHNQFSDQRLDNGYNLIAFDMRVCGRSLARPSGRHDSWTDAADLAFCHSILGLAPWHMLALEGISVNCALRFAALFPELCLSLTLCNVPAPTELFWVYTAYDEMVASWAGAEDLESLEHVAMEAVTFLVGQDCDPDLQDDIVEFWETTHPPRRRTRLVEMVNVLLHRTPLAKNVYSSITQPVLVLHGDKNETCPVAHAEKLVSQLTSAEGGAKLYIVKGGSGALSIVPGNASIANQTFAKFLSRLPPARSDLTTTLPEQRDTKMRAALERLATLMGDRNIAERDPRSVLSFSCVGPEVLKSQTEMLAHYAIGQEDAFSALGPDGRPIRRMSERKRDHWFHSERDGLSYAG